MKTKIMMLFATFVFATVFDALVIYSHKNFQLDIYSSLKNEKMIHWLSTGMQCLLIHFREEIFLQY